MGCLIISINDISVIDDCRWISWSCERYEYMRTFGVQISLSWKPGLGNGHCGDQNNNEVHSHNYPTVSLLSTLKVRLLSFLQRHGSEKACTWMHGSRCPFQLLSGVVSSTWYGPVHRGWRQCFLLRSFTTTQSPGWMLWSCTNVGSRRAAFTWWKINLKKHG